MYLCIDLKSFYASVECVERNLDPMTTALVVADITRKEGAITLAITPFLKQQNVKSRSRLYEIPKHLSYIVAPPRMQRYIDYSSAVYGVYLRFFSKEDIHVYSIDEVFIDTSTYAKIYPICPRKLAQKIMDEILIETKIPATCGIGSNLFLAKVALDIFAKHSKDNIGFLDEKLFYEKCFHHVPLTDFWQIGEGTKRRLEQMNLYTFYDITRVEESILYQAFGVDAEILIDHAWGREPTTIAQIKNYVPTSRSISYGQTLERDYSSTEARLVILEMVELLTLDLVDQNLVTNEVFLSISYSRIVQKRASAKSKKMCIFTSSYQELRQFFMEIFDEILIENTPIRKLKIAFKNIKNESFETFHLFTNFAQMEKEKRLYQAINAIKKKHGKSSILRGINLTSYSTTPKKNRQIGGHNKE